MISKLQRENSKLENNNKTLSNKIKKQEDKITRLDKLVAERKEVNDYEHNKNCLYEIALKHFIGTMSDLFQQFKELGFDAGDLIGRQYAEIFENIAVQINKGLSRWVADRAMLYHASEKSGLGSNNTSNEKEASANAINNGSLQGNRKGLGKSFEILGLLSKIIKTEDKDSVEYAMLQLAKLGTEPKIKSNSKRLISSHDRKMRARAAIKPKIIKEEHAPSKEITICDECGSDKLRTVGTIAEIVKTATDQIYKTFDQKSIVQRCICGNIMIKVPDNYDPPAIPTGHLGQSIVIRSIVDETHGMPENHANIDLQRNFQIGNDTLPRSKSYLTENIEEPMYSSIAN